jgi:hypothetical protein
MVDRKSSNEFKTARLLKKAREITSTHLPIGHSFIPYDILLLIATSHIAQKPLTVKSLFTSLPYSDMGTRYHFNRLKNNGWIELVVDTKDGRNKLCKPTKKFQTRFRLIAKDLETNEWLS